MARFKLLFEQDRFGTYCKKRVRYGENGKRWITGCKVPQTSMVVTKYKVVLVTFRVKTALGVVIVLLTGNNKIKKLFLRASLRAGVFGRKWLELLLLILSCLWFEQRWGSKYYLLVGPLVLKRTTWFLQKKTNIWIPLRFWGVTAFVDLLSHNFAKCLFLAKVSLENMFIFKSWKERKKV